MIATANLMTQDAAAATYQDVQNLIRHTVWKFQRGHGGDFDDLFSRANVIFMEAFFSHNENKASFPTWLCFKIRKGFLEMEREGCKKRLPRADLDDVIGERSTGPPRPFCEVLSELSNDAQTIVELLLELPEGLQDSMLKHGTHPRHSQAALRVYLKTFFGWTETHVIDTFREIVEVIHG